MRVSALALIVTAGVVFSGCADETVADDAAPPDARLAEAAVDVPLTQAEGSPDTSLPDLSLPDIAHPDQAAAKTGTCTVDLGCITKADCVAKGLLDCLGGKCIQCKASTDCLSTLFKGCDTSIGFCQFCAADADCTISGVKLGTGKCDTKIWSCTHCDGDADCASAGSSTKICASMTDPLGTVTVNMCLGCTTSADCASVTFKGCDTANGVCNLCTSDSECCFTGLPCSLTCDKASGKCHCGTDQECQSAYGSKLWSCK